MSKPNGKPNGTRLHNQEVHSIPILDSIRTGQTPTTPEIIAEAVTYLHRDGIIVLENSVAQEHLDTLESMLIPEALEISQNPNHHFNWNKGNMDQAPPLNPDLMYQDIWANPAVVSICSAIFGPNPVCHYANGNTALKSTARQPVHSDIHLPHPLYPFAYAINVPLCEMDEKNGSTEIWVGSHRESNIEQHNFEDLTIKEDLVEERRVHSPPVQPRVPRGSIIIRDIRLWHAGMPNRTERPRIMFAFVYQPSWFQAPSKVLLPEKVRPLVETWKEETELVFNADWVEGEVDHKLVSSDDVDFSTRNRRLMELGDLMRPTKC
ncbi:Kanamycin B dioxygenase [Pseudocercospora fuligena]|uniref:Kanamycin B dioxygenase n=1 Tax=Pseudocercospora fuligena TaxID=685502 RepID=A0A8H6VGX9_9PEZI|nr:Kanamycin B dioxygenase [Pseudocercospora fuligena]